MTQPELTASDLARELESNADLQILDVRIPERAALDHIAAPDYRNVPGSQLGRIRDLAEIGLDPARPVAVICDRGISSRQITGWLRAKGYDARSLAGGMLGWSGVVVAREVPDVVGLDRLIQLDRIGKGALGYLAIRNGKAIAVDPGRHLAPWQDALAAAGATLVAVVDTHCHADYLSGGPTLAHAHGVSYRLHPADAVDPYEGRAARIHYVPMAEGDVIALGDASFAVEHLPGHTEGSVALRLGEELALTGDLLFVASVGRPDLADRTAEWTGKLWESLERVRKSWPPAMRIFPAHYGGDAERGEGRIVEGRLASLAARNPPFAIAGRDAFHSWIAARAGEFPEAYPWIKRANLGLVDVDDDLADELEAGRNQCALAP